MRLISAEGEQLSICPLSEALRKAEEAGLDLVQMTSDSIPVVCKLMDYGKHQFESKKSRGQSKKRQKRVDVKEVKFRMGTDKADYEVKLKHLRRFLAAGHRAKVSIRFRGREMAHKDLAVKLMERIEHDLEEQGKVEQAPQLDGRQMLMLLSAIPQKAGGGKEAVGAGAAGGDKEPAPAEAGAGAEKPAAPASAKANGKAPPEARAEKPAAPAASASAKAGGKQPAKAKAGGKPKAAAKKQAPAAAG